MLITAQVTLPDFSLDSLSPHVREKVEADSRVVIVKINCSGETAVAVTSAGTFVCLSLEYFQDVQVLAEEPHTPPS